VGQVFISSRFRRKNDKNHDDFPRVSATLITLFACNLPIPHGVEVATSTVLMASVSVATEYRTGPGQVYDQVGVLNPGQMVEAVGRSPDGDYLIIRDPANPAVLRWLKSEFATVTGDPVALPISTPPPTPTLLVGPALVGGCPTPISCTSPGEGPAVVGGCPTPIGGGPTPVSCTKSPGKPTPVRGFPPVPTPVK
jgi:hypothetical protein